MALEHHSAARALPGYRRLFAEMKVPGRTWLEFVVEPDGAGSRLTQSALFDPVGVLGRAYWYGIYPLHALVFRGVVGGIAKRAAANSKSLDQPR